MAKNNIYTRSYIRKMMIENKLFVSDLCSFDDEEDTRTWSLLINKSIICTCVREDNYFYFRLYSKNDVLTKVVTKSGKILITQIKALL